MGIYRKLKARLDRAGIRPSTRRGQNFLLDSNQLQFIVESAGLGPEDVVLEVGPGSGLLTRRLALTGCLVLAVELDHGLLPVAQEETAGLPNVFYMQGDILAGKNRINPDVLARLRELLVEQRRVLSGGEPRLKCVSNLPYSAGTPFVMNLLSSDLPWELGVFLLQREVCERMVAGPGGREYGTLGIVAGLASRSRIERIVGPRCFWPRPNVDSAIVRMEFLGVGERMGLPWGKLRAVTNAVFGARRKILRNALKGVYPGVDIDGMLGEVGVDGGGRGEEMGPGEFLALARRVPDAVAK